MTEYDKAIFRSEGTITDITRTGYGGLSITTNNGSGFHIPAEAETDHVRIGGKVELCGDWGQPIQGVKVDGILCFFHTQAEMDARFESMLDRMRREREEEYEQKKDVWRAQYEALPPPLKARITRFMEDAGGFEAFFQDFGSYELFICTEAVKFATYFTRIQTEGNLTNEQMYEEGKALFALPYAEQKALVGFDDGHSGNTFGGALALGIRLALGKPIE